MFGQIFNYQYAQMSKTAPKCLPYFDPARDIYGGDVEILWGC